MPDTLILIIDTDPAQTNRLTTLFSKQSFQVKTATDGLEGMALWQMVQPNLVISTMEPDKANGLDILDFRNREFPHVPLILLMDQSNMEKGEIALQQGAFDIIASPINEERLLDCVDLALRSRLAQGFINEPDNAPVARMIGSSPFMKALLKDMKLICSTNSDVLISGEAGTGKTLLLQHIRTLSTGNTSPCISLHCPALTAGELESILLDKGLKTRQGKHQGNAFMLADGGMLCLREISALPYPLQERLYQALENGALSVGQDTVEIRTRIIVTSSRDLKTMVQNGLFHAGLYERLKTVHFHLQPLRRRGKDILELIDYFLAHFSEKYNLYAPPFSARVVKLFLCYAWPGNIGELRHLIERIILTCNEPAVTEKILPEKMRGKRGKKTKPMKLPTLPQEEKLHILATLEEAGWNQSESARRLGMTRNTLRYRMKKYKIKARPRQSSHP